MALRAVTTLVLLALTCQSLRGDRFDSVSVRTWDTVKDAESFPPELKDEVLKVPWLLDRPSFGIAFSGGGSRAATATLGQLRALRALGWLDQARHISANSGSTWTAVPFTYLPAQADEARFLGPYVPPEQISSATLAPAQEDPQAMATALHSATLIKRLGSLVHGDEAYADLVGSIYLKPFGLHNKKRVFTFHRAALKAVLDGNPDLREEDFYLVEREDRPYLILVGTMLARQVTSDPNDYFLVEITPLYTGIRERFRFDKDGEVVLVGGGYVESFGYDSYEPTEPPKRGRYQVRLKGRLRRGDNPFTDRYRFTLSDAIGISSAAPLATLSGGRFPNMTFPELRQWPVDRAAILQADGALRLKADEYQHADGGDIDNLAIMPLLARRVENILAFVNTADAFTVPARDCGVGSDDFVVDDLISLFKETGKLIHNRVFENAEEELTTLCTQFSRRQEAGEPLVHCQSYGVRANPRHGIAPYQPNICWVYHRVPPTGELNRKLHNAESPFDTFPHYATFAEQGVLVIDLDRERVNALSNLAAWAVLESSRAVREGLSTARLLP